MGSWPTQRQLNPVTVAGSISWALPGVLLVLVFLQAVGVTALGWQLLGAAMAFVAVAALTYRLARDAPPAHPLDRCAEALRELEEQLLPGPLRDHLGHVCGAVDAERLLPGRQGTEQSGWALVAANERLVLAQGAALGPALAESLDRTVILESTLHSLTEQHSLSDDYAVDEIDDQRGATP